ncbi:MAG TPA: PAS domain S-box protein [Xanthobacteraceae bacterium]|jgi:PAS domain S-box-containing protein|nr:PAS domain S-box protein [Xanthobacteraceae bacterium]
MRGYLLVMVVAILLPVIVFAGIMFQRYYDSELTRIERELQNEAHDLSLSIDRDLEGQLVALETMTTSGSLNAGEYERFYQRALRMRDYAHVDILLRDRSGQQLVNTRLPWGSPLPRDATEGDDQVVATEKPYVSNVIVGTVAKRPIYFITVPVVKDGTVSLFIHMSLELSRLVDLLKGNIDGQQIAGILDRNNVVMARTEDFDARVGKPALPQFTEKQKGDEGSWVGLNSQGSVIRVGYARSKLSGWLIWVGVPEEAVQNSLRGTFWRLTALGIGLIVLAIAIAYYLGGKLTGHITALAAQANALGRGDAFAVDPTPVRELNGVGNELRAASERRKDLEQKLVETATQESERRFQILVEGVTDYAIFLLDPQGRVTNWNSGARRIHGYTADEIVGQHFSRFYTPEDQVDGMPARALLTAINEGKYEAEGWRVRKDGTRFWASVVIDRIDDSNGQMIGLAKITRDITERRETQQRLETAREQLYQSQKMDAVGQLTGGVAHDFNNLLTIIVGNLEIARRTLETWKEGAQARLQRSVDQALTGAQRAAVLTSHLLAFSRRQPLEPKILDVNRLLNQLSMFLKPVLGEQVQLETVGAGGVWQVEADAAQLETAVLNLAVNARDAMPNGGQLTIEASNVFLDEDYCARNAEVKPGQYVLIAVTDNGTGMNVETMARAFEPFFTTKDAGQGTGLGLSQVYGFVKQSGGHVKIYSEHSHGTTVKIYLPRAHGKAGDQPSPRDGIAPSAYGQEAILVVEDDSDVRTFVCETLRDLNYAVLEASDARSALVHLDGDRPIDLLLTDVILPGPNGRELANAALVKRPDLKVLFMTGYSRNAIVHQGRLDEGVNLIQKPLTIAGLAAKIRDVLDMPGS